MLSEKLRDMSGGLRILLASLATPAQYLDLLHE